MSLRLNQMKIKISQLLIILLISNAATALNFNTNEQVLQWKTQKSIVKVERLDNSYYKLTLWKLPNTVKDSPDIILDDGIFTYDGKKKASGYRFNSGDLSYLCAKFQDRNALVIIKNGKIISDEEAQEFSTQDNSKTQESKIDRWRSLPIKEVALALVAIVIIILVIRFRKK